MIRVERAGKFYSEMMPNLYPFQNQSRIDAYRKAPMTSWVSLISTFRVFVGYKRKISEINKNRIASSRLNKINVLRALYSFIRFFLFDKV